MEPSAAHGCDRSDWFPDIGPRASKVAPRSRSRPSAFARRGADPAADWWSLLEVRPRWLLVAGNDDERPRAERDRGPHRDFRKRAKRQRGGDSPTSTHKPHLERLGVARELLPDPAVWRSHYERDHRRPIERRREYALAWE